MIISESVQGRLANSILKVYPDAKEKEGTHLLFSTGRNEIKLGFYVREETFTKNATLDQSIGFMF